MMGIIFIFDDVGQILSRNFLIGKDLKYKPLQPRIKEEYFVVSIQYRKIEDS